MAITVKQLIEQLKKQPQDGVVETVYDDEFHFANRVKITTCSVNEEQPIVTIEFFTE